MLRSTAPASNQLYLRRRLPTSVAGEWRHLPASRDPHRAAFRHRQWE